MVPFTLVAPWSSAPWTYLTFKLSWHSQFLEWKFLLVHSFIHSNQGVSPKPFVASIKMHYKNAKKRKLPMFKGCHLTTCVVCLPPKFSPLVSTPPMGCGGFHTIFTHYRPPMWFVCHQSLPGRLHFFAPFPSTNFHTNFVVVQSCNWQFMFDELLPRGGQYYVP
jgi:hypothetical protein